MAALPLPDPPLSEAVVALRPWREDDVAVKVAWGRDAEIWSLCELRMARLQALVHPANAPSARLLERLGFRREGYRRAYRPAPAGREDRVVYSVLPGELASPPR